LDDGRLTDGQGRTVDFKNTLLIMTSNLGSDLIQGYGESQRDAMLERLQPVLKSHFRPEFLNRVDEIVVFHALTEAQIRSIVRIQLRRLAALLRDRDLELEVTEAATDELAKEGFDPAFGARPLKRTIQRRMQNPLAVRVLEGAFKAGDSVVVDFVNGEFTFSKGSAGAAEKVYGASGESR
ncbi:MAG: AAA family ATPase, partial [Candidatus Rokuibacteriota bacterium]